MDRKEDWIETIMKKVLTAVVVLGLGGAPFTYAASNVTFAPWHMVAGAALGVACGFVWIIVDKAIELTSN